MSSPAKRILTEDARSLAAVQEASLPPHTSPDSDYTARLRLLGSRVRKNVTEGYTSAPPSLTPHTKSLSTGHIFRSANDTLREVYSDTSQPRMLFTSPKKRSRSVSDYPDEENSEEQCDDEGETMQLDLPESDSNNVRQTSRARPTIALRKSQRKMMATRSLPANMLVFSDSPGNRDISMAQDSMEEDWSVGSNIPASFKPVTL